MDIHEEDPATGEFFTENMDNMMAGYGWING